MQGRGQLGFDIKVEEFAVHRPVDDLWRVKPVMAQRGDGGPAPDLIRGLSLPLAEAGVIHAPRPAWRPSGGLGHVRLERSPLCSNQWRINGSLSSMKPMRVSMLRMKGWRCVIQTRRASATSGRFCSTARRVFFVCQAKAAQPPPDRDAVGLDPMPLAQFGHQFIQRQVALLLDPAFDPTRHARQLAVNSP